MTGDTTASAPEQAEPRLVVMLVYPGVMAMDVFGPLEAFASANIIAGRPLYRLAIAGKTTAPVESSLGLPIMPSVTLDDIEGPIDTLLVSGGFGQSDASCDAQLIAWLKESRLRARRYGSVCTGAFVLAAAGLLDGKRVATHWAMRRRARRRYPGAHRRRRPHLRASTATSGPRPASPPASTWRSAWSRPISAAACRQR